MINSYGQLQRLGVALATKLLAVGLPIMVATKFGQADEQADNTGLIRKWRRYPSFPITTAPIAEGVCPPGIPLNFTDVTMQLQEYAVITFVTNILVENHEDPIYDVAIERIKQAFAQTNEAIVIETLCAGSSVMYGGTGTTRATVDGTITLNMLRKVARSFERARATRITSIVNAKPLINTTPVEPGYYVMGHTDILPDIRNMTDGNGNKVFVPAVRYSQPDAAIPGERGAVEDFRFVLTDMFKPWLAAGKSVAGFLSNGDNQGAGVAANVDVYPLVAVAKDAYGVVRMKGRKDIKMAIVQPVPAAGNWLGQRGSIGARWLFGAVWLNDAWGYRMEVAATAL